MSLKVLWPRDTKGAREVQENLKARVRVVKLRRRIRYVAGVDASFSGKKVIGAACLLSYPDMVPLEESFSVLEAGFPYVPGLLSFREGPALMEAIKGLKKTPDLILFDGQGVAHPRGFGIASHLGVLMGIPSVGCAKSRLVGDFREPGKSRGMRTPLLYKGKIVGSVVRTRDGVRPLFVSPGHGTDLEGSIEVVLACTGRYRIPEPLRRADMLSKKLKKTL